MFTRGALSIPWDLYEEHLDEAAFLWGQWEAALVAAHYTLHDVAVGPESRLLAHLDGLVLGGAPVAEALLRPALTHEDSGRNAAAAWCLVQAEHGVDEQGAVLEAMADGGGATAIARALGLAPRADLERAAQVWPLLPCTAQAALFDLMAVRRPDWARPRLEACLRSGDGPLIMAGLHALTRMPDPSRPGSIQEALQSEIPGVRGEAIAAGVAAQSDAAWEACRDAATEPGDCCRLALGLLATGGQPHDRALVRAAVSDKRMKREAVWALGFAGDLKAADVLVEATEDPAVRRIAGDSLTTITGWPMARVSTGYGPDRDAELQEVGDDDAPPSVRSEDLLPIPDAAAVRGWWKRERTRFLPGVALIHGHRRTPRAIHAALETATMWRRELLWLDLACTTGIAPEIDLRGWTVNQRRQWSADQVAFRRER